MGETLRPVRATFVALRDLLGTWAVAATNIEHNLHLSTGRLGLLLSVSIGAGGVAAAVSGGLAERWGTARFMSRTLVGWGVVLLASAGVGGGAPFVITFVLSMMTAGLVDMAMNAAAAEGVGRDAGRMMRFHAFFNDGRPGRSGDDRRFATPQECRGVGRGRRWRWRASPSPP